MTSKRKPHLYDPVLPKKERHKKAKGRGKSFKLIGAASSFCRLVGPGGTEVNLYWKVGTDSVFAVYINENCPFGEEDGYDFKTGMAHDGHNVNKLSRKQIIEELGGTP